MDSAVTCPNVYDITWCWMVRQATDRQDAGLNLLVKQLVQWPSPNREEERGGFCQQQFA